VGPLQPEPYLALPQPVVGMMIMMLAVMMQMVRRQLMAGTLIDADLAVVQ
jgi:hypothetical protein